METVGMVMVILFDKEEKTMKKSILILCVVILFCGLNLQAKPVSLNQAQDIAKKILESQPATKSGSGQIRLIWDGEDVATKASQPAFYVFGRDGGGFVIIAGDDNVTPVLAISESNEFKTEGMPENVKWWMDRMKVYVRTAKIQSAEVRQQWASYIATKNASVPAGSVIVQKTRFTPEWNQRDPYNGLCPFASSNRTVTGCVALAISEILSYQAKNKTEMSLTMPAKGTGTVGGYSVTSGYVAPASYVLNTTYDWDVIANFNAATATNEQKTMLARLIADIGAIVEAAYSENLTSANSFAVSMHMAEHFSFNKAATREMAAWYSNRQWINKLKAEINQRPLYYFGTSPSGGHAFVFDGYGTYNAVDVFHVNFGWGGTNNGYYYYTNLDTSASTDGSEDWSKESSGAIFGFYPDPSSSYPVKLQASYSNDEYPGVSVELTPSSCTYKYSIFNNENTTFNGEIKFKVRKKNGTEIEVPYNTETIEIPPQHRISGSFGFSGGTITGIEFGDCVVCYYWNGSTWVLLDCIPGSAIAQWPLMPVSFIKTTATYSQNDWFTFELMNIDYVYPGTVWTITDKDGNVTVKQQSDYEVQLTNTGTYKIEAATAKTVGGAVVERLVTYITVNP